MKIKLTFITLFILISSSVFSQSIITLQENSKSRNVSNAVELFEDKTGKLGINEVLDVSWIPNKKDSISYGYTNSSIWLKLTITNKSKNSKIVLIGINNPHIDFIDIFIPHEKGYERVKSGDMLPFNTRKIRNRHYVFPIVQGETPGTYYLKLYGKSPINFSVSLLSERGYSERLYKYLPLFWIVFGLMLFLIVYNFFIFFRIREKVYLYFSFFSIFLFLVLFHLYGFAFQYLWPNSIYWNQVAVFFFVSLTGSSMAMYFIELIKLKDDSKLKHRIIIYTVVIPGLLFAMVSFVLSNIIFFKRILYFWMMYNVFICILYVVTSKIREKLAVRYAFVGFVAFLIGIIIYVLSVYSVIPYNIFTMMSIQLGSIVMMVFFTFSLIEMLRDAKQQLEKSKSQLFLLNTDLNATNEELLASNEELLAINEELINSREKLLLSEKELKDSEAKLRIIFKSASLGIGIAENRRIIWGNEYMLKIFGYSADELLGKDTRILYESDEEYIESGLKIIKGLEKGSSVSFETELVRKSGERFSVQFHISSIEDGDLTKQIILIEDITEKKKTRELIIKSEKMNMIGGLAAGMAHEINNPLGIILQGIQNSIRRVSPDLDKNRVVAEKYGIDLLAMEKYLKERKIFDYFDGMRDAGERAAEIVKSMLNFTRSGDSSVQMCNINDIIDDAIKLAWNDYDLKKKYNFRNLEIIKNFSESIDLIAVSSEEVKHVIVNLLKNAAIAIKNKKFIDDTPVIKIETSANEKSVIVELSDNGIGLENEMLPRIFEPFFTKDNIRVGSGLGLSVSYYIITNKYNGTIDVESIPGQGTKFTVKFPLTNRSD